MDIPLSDHWSSFVRDQVSRGRFSSEAEVVEESLRLLEQRMRDDARNLGAVAEPTAGAETPIRSIGEIIDEIMSDVPEEVLDRYPTDGAEQHDHYIYGTPKRPA